MIVDKIRVKLDNHSMLMIDCDRGIAQEISEYFSFFAPGYKFMKKFKEGLWDGKIRIFDLRSRQLPAGLFFALEKFCKNRDYELLVVDDDIFGSPTDTIEVNPAEIMAFIKTLGLQSKGRPINVRDYQLKAVCKAINAKRAVLLSPTSSGKSLIIYILMRWFLEHRDDKQKVLIIVPTTSLIKQMHSDFEDYGWDVDKNIHTIYSGKSKSTSKPVILSTWQSIYKLQPQWFSKFGAIFGDECHGFKALSLSSIMNKSTNAEFRWGTTGTLDGKIVHDLVLQGLFGKIYRVTTTKKLQDQGTVSDLSIKMLMLEYPEQIRKNWGKRKYDQEVDFINNYEYRNKFIKNLALDLKGNTLILFQIKKHGQAIHDLIEKSLPEGRNIYFVSGDIDVDDREKIRKIIETEEDAILVASMGTFSTGINIKNLHNIIFATFSKSQVRILQSIGRQLRLADNGVGAVLYDIIDDISIGEYINYAIKHSIERMKIYKAEQFKFKTYRIKLK